jgi:mono/diheme cytochrome c family protein
MKRGGPAGAASAAGILLLLVGFPYLQGSADARPAAPQNSTATAPVTFNRDIAPIMFHYCATCHRPGESGPFPLLTYKDAKSHARQIAAVTKSRFMPP